MTDYPHIYCRQVLGHVQRYYHDESICGYVSIDLPPSIAEESGAIKKR